MIILSNFKRILSRRVKYNSSGFTIIEILSVLLIGMLLISLGLLSLSTAQRSGRNSQRDSDISAINKALANFIANNNGAFPKSVVISTTTKSAKFCSNVAAKSLNSCSGNGNIEFNLNIYGNSAESIRLLTNDLNSNSTPYARLNRMPAVTNLNLVVVTQSSRCIPGFIAEDERNVIRRSVSVQYAKESSGSTGSPQCVNLFDQ